MTFLKMYKKLKDLQKKKKDEKERGCEPDEICIDSDGNASFSITCKDGHGNEFTFKFSTNGKFTISVSTDKGATGIDVSNK
jgi:hypothetical protein